MSSAIIYADGKAQLLIMDEPKVIEDNFRLYSSRYPDDTFIRSTDGTPFEGVIQSDPRIPATVEEFDALYGSPET